MIKKRTTSKTKTTRVKPVVLSTMQEDPQYVVPVHYQYGPPYPLPEEEQVESDEINISDVRKLWKTKTFWSGICLFLLSLCSIVFGLPQFASNPTIIGLAGMIMAILWIVLRMMINQPVSPSINFPHPNEWLYKNKKNKPQT